MTGNQCCPLQRGVNEIEVTGQANLTKNCRQLEALKRQCALSHTCFMAVGHLTRNGIVTTCQPADFFLFPKCKTNLKGEHHLDAIKTACTQALKDISVTNFEGVYAIWKTRLQKCVDAQEDCPYFFRYLQ